MCWHEALRPAGACPPLPGGGPVSPHTPYPTSPASPHPTLQVNLQNLKDRARWASGWLQKDEMRALEAERDEAAQAGPACKACGASGRVACPLCSRGGQVVEL